MGQVYHPDDAYTIADPNAMKMIGETPVEYAWYKQMNHEAFEAFVQHPLRNVVWAWIKIRQTFSEFTNNGMGILYPLLWIGIPFFSLRNKPRFFMKGIVLGGALSFVHLVFGNWDIYRPVSLLHTKFNDVILLGAAGFALMILEGKKPYWKLFASSFLTLIFSVSVYIAHLRARLVLVDWILIISAAYVLVRVIDQIQLRLNCMPFGQQAQNE